MLKSNLIHLLRTFDKKELRNLKKWLQSPVHNQREDVVRLLGYLGEENHLGQDEKLEKSLVFRHVFPNETYNDAKMRQVIYFLSKEVEDFLIYDELSKDEISSRIMLAKIYRQRKLGKLFEKNYKNTNSLMEEWDYRDGEYLRKEYTLKWENYYFLSDFKRTNFNYQEVSNALDLSFISDKLRESCVMLTHQRVYKTEYDIGLLEDVLRYVEMENLLDVPAIALYYYGYKAIKEKDDENSFWKLKEELLKSGDFFPTNEIRNIHLIALNYCIQKMNEGKDLFIREAFELYRDGFEKKILIDGDSISQWTFTNVVAIALKLNEHDWAELFINNFQKYLPKKLQETFVNYNTAQLYYNMKQFDQAMLLLVQFDAEDIILNLRAKILLAKLYYEQEEMDALDSLLESVRNYLQRKKMLAYHKANYKNIIRYTKKLIKVNPYNNKQKEKLSKEVQMVNPLTEKEWLLNQLQDL